MASRRFELLRFLLFAAGLWFTPVAALPSARAADAPSVAVLPLSQASASAAYTGLGRALAGMVVSDLSRVPAVQLVEREQLDSLLDEMALGETAFIAPETAQKLGKGVGARYVVLGSFSVVDTTFLLDARIVEVSSGKVVKAAAQSGDVSDFVGVEKALVEDLVVGLDLTLAPAERRKLLSNAPTEKFSALAAYGEGLAAQHAGKASDAEAAFRKAVAEDPAFAEAQAALTGLAASIEAERSARESRQRDARITAANAILRDVPDPRTVREPLDAEGMVRWSLRLAALHELSRDCERYAEMRGWAQAVGWRIAAPAFVGSRGSLDTYQALLLAWGFDRGSVPYKPADQRRKPYGQAFAEGWELLTSPGRFVVGVRTAYSPGTGLVDSLLRCHPDASVFPELDALAKELRAAGVAEMPAGDFGAVQVDEALAGIWLLTRGERMGPDDELARRGAALLERARGRPVQAVDQLTAYVANAKKNAEDWAAHHLPVQQGVDAAEIARRMKVLADGGAAATPVCKAVVEQNAYMIHLWTGQVAGKAADDAPFYDMAFSIWSTASELGCIPGVAARVPTVEAAWARLDTIAAAPPARPECQASLAGFSGMLATFRSDRADPAMGPPRLVQAWTQSEFLVKAGCAAP